MRLVVATACCALLFGVGTAQAGNPRVIDPDGEDPHGVVDTTGALHVVWLHDGGSGDDTIRYCKVARGPGGCAAPPQTLAVPAPYDDDLGVDTPFIYRQGNTLRVVLNLTGVGRLFGWTSANLGTTFSSAVLEADNTQTSGQQNEPGVQEGSTLVYNAGRFAQGITFGGGFSTGTDFATLEYSGDPVSSTADMERAPTGEYVAGDSEVSGGDAPIWVNNLGSGVNTSANWDLTQELDSREAPRFVRTADSLFAVTAPPTSGTQFRLKVHKFNSATNTFGAGVDLPGPLKIWHQYNVTYAAGRI